MLLLVAVETFAHEGSGAVINKTIVKNGIGLGSVIAVVISWDRNKSVLYSFIHGVFGWLYVIYFIIVRDKK